MRFSRLTFVAVLMAGAGCSAREPARPAVPLVVMSTLVVPPPAADSQAPLVVTALRRERALPPRAREVAGPLRGALYLIPEGTQQLPDFRRMHPFAEVLMTEINVSQRPASSGFPGAPGRVEWFAARHEGGFRVPFTGVYQFRVTSDDGSRLILDGRQVVDLDGVHSATSATGTLHLEAGMHHLELEYFQGPRFDIALQLYWTPPGQPESILQFVEE